MVPATTVPLIRADAPAVLKRAVLLGPLVISHGVPATPDQFVDEVVHAPLSGPVQVAVAAEAEKQPSAAIGRAPMPIRRKTGRMTEDFIGGSGGYLDMEVAFACDKYR